MLFVIFWVEYEGSRFLQNIGIYQPEYMETTIKTVTFMLLYLTIICRQVFKKKGICETYISNLQSLNCMPETVPDAIK
jgi:hypothetical protein